MGEPDQVINMETAGKWVEQKYRYNQRDLLCYAAGIGCRELKYTYENNIHFAAFPTYPVVLSFKGDSFEVCDYPSKTMVEGPPLPVLKGVKVDLDGERYIEMIKPIDPRGGEIKAKSRFVGVHKKGSGAVITTESILSNDQGDELYKIRSGSFYVGATGFKDAGTSYTESVKLPAGREHSPDAVVEMKTSLAQALMYRLSGDYNPLHIDPVHSSKAGFEDPILHGLCSLGISVRAVLKEFAHDNPMVFKAVKVRFAKPVIPGETLLVEMWKDKANSRIIFQTKVKGTDRIAINNAYVVLNESHVWNPEARL